MSRTLGRLKIAAVNLAVFIAILIGLELLAGFGRFFSSKDIMIPFSTTTNHDDPSHPCIQMKTDVLLDHVHNTNGNCHPVAGMVQGEYVVYNASNIKKPILVTLGGSTTSGFYQHVSSGETYPKILAEYAKDDFFILNGGVGGYSSLQEFYKFARDGAKIEDLKLVVSLNGINEVANYYGENSIRAKHYPFLTNIQYSMNLQQQWIDQRVSINFFQRVFPNLFEYIQAISLKKKQQGPNLALEDSTFGTIQSRSVGAADRWEKNVRRLNQLVRIEGAEYMVFLQPTLGLEGPQSSPPPNSSDAKLLMKAHSDYLIEINELYKELKERCRQLSFCYDISDKVPPTGEMYNDLRHHNAKGNALLANEIWTAIQRKYSYGK